jgi:hypothetical protein
LNYLFSPGIAVGAHGLIDLELDSQNSPIEAYAGAGPLLILGSDFSLAIETFLGGEYRFVEADFSEAGLFLEVGPTLYILPLEFGFTGRFGFNYHFTFD